MARSPEAERLCSTCGAANVGYATFCLECGEPLEAAGARPAPPGHAVRRQPARRELVLGAILVLVVLAVALGDWWHREAQEQTYRDGDRAAARRDWERAAALFGGLGDYRDAPRRRDEIVATLAQRETGYQAGQDALRAADWLAAYRAFSATFILQPDYRDTRALLDQAARQASQAALTHTIYRRVRDGASGLYLRQASGAADRFLPGSDGRSRVRQAAGGRVIYDGPIAGVPTGPDVPSAGQQPLPPDRQLLLTDLGPGTEPLVLPRQTGRGGQIMPADTGLWSYAAPRADQSPPPTWNVPIDGTALGLLAYYLFPSGPTIGVISAPANYYVFEADAARARLLIGQQDPPGTAQPHTSFYLAGRTGVHLQPLAHVEGVVQAARLSADGRHLLYTALVDPGADAARIELQVLDLQGPQPLAQFRDWMIYEPNQTALQGEFVPGPGAPRLLVRRENHGTVRWDLHALGNPEKLTLWEGPGGLFNEYHLAPDGAFFSFWGGPWTMTLWNSIDGPTPGPIADPLAPILVVQPLTAPYSTTQVPLTVPPMVGTLSFADVGVAGDHVVYTYSTRPGGGALPMWGYDAGMGEIGPNRAATPVEVELHVQPLSAATDLPVALLRAPFAADGAPGMLILPPDLVAYVVPGNELRLRMLDGGADLPGIPGVDAVWWMDPARTDP
jgi:hypothetical protein